MQEPIPNQYQVAWNLFTELRKETLESQKIRAQVIGFKITFISTGVALIASNPDKLSSVLFVIPAFAAIFFDLLIASYGFSIKRIGHYCRTHIEQRMRASCSLPDDFLLWQEFLRQPKMRQNLGDFANIGMTLLALVPAVLALFKPFHPITSVGLLGALLVLFVYDIGAQSLRWRFKDDRSIQNQAA